MRKSYAILLSALLASCGTIDKSGEDNNEQVKISTGDISADAYIPGGMDSHLQGKGERMSAKKEKELLDLVRDEDIAYTDPDDPYADIQEIDEAFMRKKQTAQLWGQSYDTALREARTTGKGILIWFHDKRLSPPSKYLDSELFSQKEFLGWAKDNLVLLCYDKNATYRPEKRMNEQGFQISEKSIKIRKDEYVDGMFSRFSIRGAPAVVMVSPDGQQIDSWSGYKRGTKDFVFDKIKNNVNISRQKFEEFKKRLARQGYKEWRGRNGSSLFAKFTRYDSNKSEVWLREFDGRQTKTKLAGLISEDQQWVLDETQKLMNGKKTSF